MDDRKQIKIYVTAAAKDSVERFAAQYDMTEMGVASRVYEWFGSLPAGPQKWITGLVDGTENVDVEKLRSALGTSHETIGHRSRVASGKEFRQAAKPLPTAKK